MNLNSLFHTPVIVNVPDVGGTFVNANSLGAYGTPLNVNGPGVDGNQIVWTPNQSDLLCS